MEKVLELFNNEFVLVVMILGLISAALWMTGGLTGASVASVQVESDNSLNWMVGFVVLIGLSLIAQYLGYKKKREY